jgi:DNA-binding MarR family transcriptional regulator
MVSGSAALRRVSLHLLPRRSPADCRRVLVDLTPAGQAVLDRVLPEVQQLVTAVMGTSTTRPSTPCWTT